MTWLAGALPGSATALKGVRVFGAIGAGVLALLASAKALRMEEFEPGARLAVAAPGNDAWSGRGIASSAGPLWYDSFFRPLTMPRYAPSHRAQLLLRPRSDDSGRQMDHLGERCARSSRRIILPDPDDLPRADPGGGDRARAGSGSRSPTCSCTRGSHTSSSTCWASGCSGSSSSACGARASSCATTPSPASAPPSRPCSSRCCRSPLTAAIYGSNTIGASGALYGLLLAFALYYPERPILMFMLFPVPAKYFVMILGGSRFCFGQRRGAAGRARGASRRHDLRLPVPERRRRRLTAEIKYRYVKWKMNRLRRKFDVYSGGRSTGTARCTDISPHASATSASPVS